jgi:hypothetical protein
MRTLCLMFVLMIVLSGSCFADTTAVDIYEMYTWISAPLVPYNPDPAAVLSGFNIVGNLVRWEAVSQGPIAYDDMSPEAFGAILLGDGYTMWVDPTNTEPPYQVVGQMSYDGVPNGVPDGSGNKTDMWISLPGNQVDSEDVGGLHWIGQPFDHDTSVVGNIYFTDGSSLKTWEDANGAGWVENAMTKWDPVFQGPQVVTFDLGDDDHLRKGNGYQILTYRDNLAMIIPSDPS